MIKFFRVNQPLLSYALIPVTLICLIPVFLTTSGYRFEFFLGDLIGRLPVYGQHFVVFVVLVSNAISINRFVIRFLRTHEKNFLTALFYIILSCVQIYWFGFSSFYIATLFFIPSMTYLLSINHQKKILDLSFRSGFWLGITIIFEPSLAILVFFYLLSYFFSRASSFREWFVLIIGVIQPIFFYSFYLMFQGVSVPIIDIHFGLFGFQEFRQSFHSTTIFFIIYSAIILLLSVVAFYKNYRSSVHYDKVAKKTFIVVGFGILFLGLINLFESPMDYFGLLTLFFVCIIPSFLVLIKKEKIGVLLLNLYAYLTLILIALDYFN